MWLLHSSLLCCLMPALLSASLIIDTFVDGCLAILFLIAPLPPSTVVIPPVTASTLEHCRAPIVLWCGCLSSVLAGCCVASHHTAASCLPAPLPTVSPLPSHCPPFVVQIQEASAASDAAITPLWPRQSLLWPPPPFAYRQPLSSHSRCC